MSDGLASQFSTANIPYGIASSATRPTRQCVTRIGDEVVFLAELVGQPNFEDIDAPLHSIFMEEPTLNRFASQSKNVHLQVRSAIQKCYADKLHSDASENINSVTLHLPLHVGDFTDFSSSANHVQNASEAIFGQRSFPPAFHKYPVGYAGRCSSIVVSGTPVTRPLGQFVEDFTAPEKKIVFGPELSLDYELEIGAVVGRPVEPGALLHAKDADEHVFGLVLVNDWSARQIQALEMNPLGPFNGKNFMTSLSPWVVTLEALKAHEVKAVPLTEPVAPFLDDPNGVQYDIRLEVDIIRNNSKTTTCKVNMDTTYWTVRHMLAHHAIGGAGLRSGDLIATGTVSGVEDHEHGCLMEYTMNGKQPKKLSDGTELKYLEDGDEVRFSGIVGDANAGIGFGGCVGVVQPAKTIRDIL